MFDNAMTSDILIYNVLNNSDDEFISKCNLKFIDKSVPAEEDDTIYIAHMDLETRQELFESTEYSALVNVYVKTKDTDYLEASRFLRTVVKHIKAVLRNDKDCKARKIVFRNTTFEYGSKYTLKGLHLIIQMIEHETYSLDDDYYRCVNIIDEHHIDVE